MKQRMMSNYGAAFVRALRTGIQTALGMLGASTMIQMLDWQTVAGATAMAALIAFLQGVLVGLPEVEG